MVSVGLVFLLVLKVNQCSLKEKNQNTQRNQKKIIFKKRTCWRTTAINVEWLEHGQRKRGGGGGGGGERPRRGWPQGGRWPLSPLPSPDAQALSPQCTDHAGWWWLISRQLSVSCHKKYPLVPGRQSHLSAKVREWSRDEMPTFSFSHQCSKVLFYQCTDW